ncbi:MAG TPA: hypothetical protein VIM16_17495 [Mucilaginibacter sp.]|jgi:hypothetical protein
MLQYYEHTPRLIQEYREFAEITETAAVTFQQVEGGGKDKAAGELRFNLFTSPEKYETSLQRHYAAIVSELEAAIADKYLKIEKLNFLSQHIIEVSALNDLIIDAPEGIRHLNFSFANLAKDKSLKAASFSQTDVQHYLIKMRHYVTKLHRYLHELKHNIEITRQTDFVLPQHMVPNPNESSTENPLAWFEYLITKNGLDFLRNYFKPSEDDFEYGYSTYDEDTEVKTDVQQDPETGEWETLTYKFADFLLNRLSKEFYKSRDMMELVVNKADSKKKIKLALVLWLSKLSFLKASIEKNKQFKKYEVLPRPIEGLIRYLYEKYHRFCPKPDNIARTIIEKSSISQLAAPKTLALPEANHPGVFRWMKNEAFRNSTLLHAKLNTVFIADMTLEAFHKVFSGGTPTDFQTIKWIDRTPNELHSNKVTLLYLFKRLSEAGLIDVDYEATDMLKKLYYVFRDHKGGFLENLLQSRKNVETSKKKNNPIRKEIDNIVGVLLS